MYADPRHIRNRRINLSLNEVELRLAEVAAEFNGMQLSAYLRDLALSQLERRTHERDSAGSSAEMRVRQ